MSLPAFMPGEVHAAPGAGTAPNIPNIANIVRSRTMTLRGVLKGGLGDSEFKWIECAS